MTLNKDKVKFKLLELSYVGHVISAEGLKPDPARHASDCAVCMSYQPNQQKELMISHEILTRPWEKVGCDLFDFEDNNYLVCVDYWSDYFEIDKICDKKGKEVISKLKSQLALHGIPDQVFSDNGPPFRFKGVSGICVSL